MYAAGNGNLILRLDIGSPCNSVAAYAGGINNTPMDYLTNGMGEALQENALRNRSDGGYYQSLFTPQSAARTLLNLSEDETKVSMRTGSVEKDGSVTVLIDFPEEAVSVEVNMIQPYGEEGIWIPQN